jgi:pSer/pThr/pTyr-binding forkhead associated (FHA) protein
MEIIKNGLVLSEEVLPLDREYLTIGRLPTCDVSMEHASVSRHHGVLQFGQEGVFVYDLGSTHGTFLNKQRIVANKYIKLPIDAILRFGESTRHYVILPLEPLDAVAGTRVPWKEEPLKFLRKFLKNQNEELDLVVEPGNDGGFLAKISLDASIFSSSSENLLQGTGTGRSKKEASDKAAADVCEQVNELEGFVQERLSLGRRRSLTTPDDKDDSFFDRTAKRAIKEARGSKDRDSVETVESLYSRQASLKYSIESLLLQLAEAEKSRSPLDSTIETDELDAVINRLNSEQASKDIKQVNLQLMVLRLELEKLEIILKAVDPKEEFKLFASPVESTQISTEKKMPDAQAKGVDRKAFESKTLENAISRSESDNDEGLTVAAGDQAEWIPPDEAESERTRLLKEKYGY